MKFKSLSFFSILFVITSCSSDADKFSGVWQSVNDPSKQIIFTQSGKTYSFETRNIESSLQGTPGTYNADDQAVEFIDSEGDTIQLVYNASAQHIVGLGEEFEKATSIAQDKNEAKEAAEEPADSATSENTASSTTTGSCDKGDILVISGNNVRVRNEPDVTKQNILFQVHKNYEVVHLDDKSVDGQKWYKVCYDGNIGWVSGQYAAKK